MRITPAALLPRVRSVPGAQGRAIGQRSEFSGKPGRLALLRRNKLVKTRKEAQTVFYSMNSKFFSKFGKILFF